MAFDQKYFNELMHIVNETKAGRWPTARAKPIRPKAEADGYRPGALKAYMVAALKRQGKLK